MQALSLSNRREVGVGVSDRPPTVPSPPNGLRLILVSLLILLFSFVLHADEPVPLIDYPNNCPRRVDAAGIGAAIARRIEGRNGPIGSTQEAVIRAVRVIVPSRDLPFRVDASRDGPDEASARTIESRECAVASAQEAVIHAVRVIVVSRDLLCPVDAYGVRSGGGAGGVEGGQCAVASAQEAVNSGTAVIRSRNHPRPVNGRSPGARPEPGALRARRIAGNEAAVRSAQEAVAQELRVS